jgi:hypothetical protein
LSFGTESGVMTDAPIIVWLHSRHAEHLYAELGKLLGTVPVEA